MYSYTYDENTGGLLLNASPTKMSKEPRPVYGQELDILGCQRIFKYDSTLDIPYMWAEDTTYYYRGIRFGQAIGGSAFNPPHFELDPGAQATKLMALDGGVLQPIDLNAMVDANQGIMQILEMSAARLIVRTYERFKNKVDCFHVAFSGGKDSWVLLDIILRTLPTTSFIVLFGDTGMEFPDTYESVKLAQDMCDSAGITFRVARSSIDCRDSWITFGPPSNVLRWCCSVHKAAPQIQELRRLTGKTDYVGLDFVGVRKQESNRRSEYEALNYGKKIKGQYDCYPLLEWTSAEVFLYIFTRNLPLSESYKKGISRAGCLVCPHCGGHGEAMRNQNYPAETGVFHNLIRESSDKEFTDERFVDFMNKNAWKTRGDGRFVKGTERKYSECVCSDGTTRFDVIGSLQLFHEWRKTMDWDIDLKITEIKRGYSVRASTTTLRAYPSKARLLRQTLKKSAYCVACGVCEMNCRFGAITRDHDMIHIEECRHCGACHELPGGCLLFDSLKLPNGKRKMRSLNSFNDHAPRASWLAKFFRAKDDFFVESDLGPDQEVKFRVFLRDAELINDSAFSETARILAERGWKTPTSLAIMLFNLVANNPQIEWYVRNMQLGRAYTRSEIKDMLRSDGCKERAANTIAKAFTRIVETPLGTDLGFGTVLDTKELTRTKCEVVEPEAILYGLYKFAEQCGGYKDFTLHYLLGSDENRSGVSPANVLGVDKDVMIRLLTGLSKKYPDFVAATFTHDLERISLAENKSSLDVLKLNW